MILCFKGNRCLVSKIHILEEKSCIAQTTSFLKITRLTFGVRLNPFDVKYFFFWAIANSSLNIFFVKCGFNL